MFQVVPSICYLGDCLSSGGGCELAIFTRCRFTWGKFKDFLAVLTSRSLPITSKGRVYNSCQKCHAPCKWNLDPNPLRLASPATQRPSYDSLDVTTNDQVSSEDLFGMMQLDDLAKVFRTHRLKCHGHVGGSDGWFKTVQKLNPTRGRGRGRTEKTWTGKRKAWSDRLSNAIRMDTPLLLMLLLLPLPLPTPTATTTTTAMTTTATTTAMTTMMKQRLGAEKGD